VLSTITSPVFSKVVVIYRDYDLHGIRSNRAGVTYPPSNHQREFRVFREMHKVRGFQLVLCADVWDRVVVEAVRELKQVVAAERAGRGFSDRFPEPLVIPHSRGSGPTYAEEMCSSGKIPWTPM